LPRKITDDLFIDTCNRLGNDWHAIAAELNLDPHATHQRLNRMMRAGRVPDSHGNMLSPVAELRAAKEKIKILEAKLLTDEYVKSSIIRTVAGDPKIPNWTTKPMKQMSDLAGVPTLFLSDWHWGEVVRPSEIGGVNEYNMKIARRRAETVLNVATELLTKHLASAKYPGICLILGGDMLSGDIHDELKETNEEPTTVVWLDLLGVLTQIICCLQVTFGNVFVVCVTGNHGRMTQKPRAKRRNHSNWDWLLYQVLRRNLESERVNFMIPDGPDALFRLYHHRYMLTHGDQFRGGDGIIGPLGPITRGDIKKRSRQAQVQAGYDTLLMGHWHQLIQLDSLIVNGSLKGYDEYAASNNFKFESPRQGLWITHPDHGITFSMPVYAERRSRDERVEWASIPA
jgi:hypothetical protein